MHPHDKLFIPGPVEVSEKTWAAFSRPLIGHRSEDFRNLYREIHPKLQTLFGTKQPVFLSTSSAWGVMEASIRNVVDRGVLCCMCGAFSDKWFDVAKRCGKSAEPLQVEWGKHIDPKDLDRQLATGKFDTVTLTHSETSTGVMNPLPEICCVLAKYPDVALIVDTVSSFSGVKIEMDALGIDVMLTGAQKALALPPGFSLFSVSEKAFERADKVAESRILFRFPGVQERAGAMDDAEHAEHRTRSRAPSSSSMKFSRKASKRVTLVTHARMRSCTIGCAALDSIFCRGRVPHEDAHLREKQ